MTIRTAVATKIRTRSAGALVAILLLAVAAAGCMPAEERTFVDRTNALRAAHGIAPLAEHDTLTAKAEAWAQQMAATGNFVHSNLSADLPGVAWTALGENIAWTSYPDDVLQRLHDQFVNSPPHKANLLNGSFTHMGVGLASDGQGKVYVAQVFARI